MNILHNHIGYHPTAPKTMIVELFEAIQSPYRVHADLLEVDAFGVVLTLEPEASGEVPGWKNRWFFQFGFSGFSIPGTYCFRVDVNGNRITGQPFAIAENLLFNTLTSDLLFYFKGQRSSGRWDLVDRQVPFYGSRKGRVDVHGGWYDASGDYSKYLSHLSYANYLNPQQSPLVVWAMLDLGELLASDSRYAGRLLEERAFEEAFHGADFLMRMQDPTGYFYMTVFDTWSKKGEERMICAFKTQKGEHLEEYQAGFRQGGGMAIAALAKSSRFARNDIPEDGFAPADFLGAAIKGYDHLLEHNLSYLDNHRENIIDYYCALMASNELYLATENSSYLYESRRWAKKLGNLFSYELQTWMAEDGNDRPFYHASDSGLPMIALMRYHALEPDPMERESIVKLLVAIFLAESQRSNEIFNPFRLGRHIVRPVGGDSKSAFFVPHVNETGYWWQGENARLASLSCAAWDMARLFPSSKPHELDQELCRYAQAQIDWILGCNPFDMCMLQGRGWNNPVYDKHHHNAPGGICNGITAGYADEEDIDFLPLSLEGRSDHRWRWSEQWICHGAWMLLALVSSLRFQNQQ
jgi:hypothetical protein